MEHAPVLQAVGLSVSVACASVLLTLPPGLYLGWLLARRSFRGRGLVQMLVMLPLVLPPVVTGYLLLVFFSPRGWLGAVLLDVFGLRVAFGWTGAVVAAGVVGFPLLVQQIRHSVEAVDPRYERLSLSLGRSGWAGFWRVTFPLARPGILAGVLLAFARSLGEFGATITLAGYVPGETNTIALTIFRALEAPGGERLAFLLSMIAVAVAAAVLGGYEALNRRHRTRIEWEDS